MEPNCSKCSSIINKRQQKQSGLCLCCRKRKNANFKNINNKKNLDYCIQVGSKFGFQCLSTEYINSQQKIKWQCANNHIWEQKYGHIERGHGCPECAGKKKHTIQVAKELAANNNGHCLSTQYTNNKSELNWQCNKGHTWGASLKDVKEGHWCGYCSIGKTENKVRQIFENIFNKKFPTARPTWLKNNTCKRSLQLDGYNEELGLAFEYDGEFHVKAHPKDKTLNSLEKRKLYDNLKDELCQYKDIKLIRIPFTQKDNLENYIKEKLYEAR